MVKVIFKNEFREIPYLGIEWYKKFEVENGKIVDFKYLEEETVIEIPEQDETVIECCWIESRADEEEEFIDSYWKARFRVKNDKLILKDVLEFNGYKEQEINKLDSSVVKKMRKQIEEDMVYRME